MTPIIVLLLALMWIAVLVPPYLRSRGERLPSESRNRGLSALGRRLSSQGYMPVGAPAARTSLERTAEPLPTSAVRAIGPDGLHLPRVSSGFEIRGSIPEPGPSAPQPAPEPAPQPRVRTEPVAVSPEDLRDQSDEELLARYDDELDPTSVSAAPEPEYLAEVTELSQRRHHNGNGSGYVDPAGNGHASSNGDSSPAPAAVLARRQQRARRRTILKGLLAACGVTLLMAFGLGGSFFFLHLLCDLALAGYVYMLVHMQKSQAEREIKVAFLPHGGSGVAPSALLEQSGGWEPGGLRPVQSEVR